MVDAAEDGRQIDVGRYLRAVLRPGELVVDVGGPTAISEELSRDVGVRVVTLEGLRFEGWEASSSPRLLCISAGTKVEPVLSHDWSAISGRGPLVLVEKPDRRVERVLEMARSVGYPVAVPSFDRSVLMLVHYRDILDALETTPGALDEPVSDTQELAAGLARQTQQLRRLEAELFSLKSRIHGGGRRGAAKAQVAVPAKAHKARGGDLSTLQRKYRKLRSDPRLFFADSRSWLVRDVLGRLYLSVGTRGAGPR